MIFRQRIQLSVFLRYSEQVCQRAATKPDAVIFHHHCHCYCYDGVFELVALSTEQRTEIGVRKVNRTHSDRIVRMFCLNIFAG